MITFNDLREASGDIVKNIMDPNTLRDMKTLASQLSAGAQANIPDILEKIENRLNASGYTLGELDLDDIEDDGSDDYFILTKSSDHEIVRNAFLTVEWDTMASPASSVSTRPDGGKLRLDVLITVNELSPREMDKLIDDTLSDNDEDTQEINSTDGDRGSEIEPDDVNEELLVEAAIRIKVIGRELRVILGDETITSLIVNPSGSIILTGSVTEIPKQFAETVVNALVEHYIEKTQS